MTRRTLSAFALLLLSWVTAVAQPVTATKFFGSTTDRFDGFGMATDMHGDLMVVGAFRETDHPPSFYVGGRLFVFRYTGSGPWAGWEEEARLYPTPEYVNQAIDYGEAVAVLHGVSSASGSEEAFVIGGAPNETIGEFLPNNIYQGAAYVHRRDATGAWALDGRLVPEGVGVEDYTGSAVALAADTAGAVWAAAWSDRYYVVWRREGPHAWVEEARFDADAYSLPFGRTVLGGSAPGPAGPGALFAAPTGDGSVRVWRHDGGQSPPWMEEAALVPSADGPYDAFGTSVALDGDLLVVGSRHAASGSPPGGRAYVFRYTGDGPFGGWEEEAVLEPAVPRRSFGRYVSAEAVAGGADAVAVYSGIPAFGTVALHLFRRDPATGTWGAAPPVEGAEAGFTGRTRGLAGGFAVLGDYEDGERGDRAGAAYVIDLRGLAVSSEPGSPEGTDSFALRVWPNPARSSATVALTLSGAGPASVGVFDVLGRRVAVLHEGPLPAGEHAFAFEGRRLVPGVYVVRVTSSAASATARLSIVR